MPIAKFEKSPLRQYVEDHPHAWFTITTDMLGPCIIRTTKAFSGGYIAGIEVAHYSRDRDCRRALRELGFVQQGKVWKRAKIEAVADETTHSET